MYKHSVEIVVAADLNNGIGINGRLPWSLPGDLARFKKLTTDVDGNNMLNAVMMGRITYESIGHILPDRLNVIISSTLTDIPNCHIYDSITSAVNSLQQMRHINKIFIIGGERIYREAMELDIVDKIHLTRIKKTYDCDRFIEPIDEKKYKLTYLEPYDVYEMFIFCRASASNLS